MAAYDVVQFDGTPLGTGTDYDAWLDARDQYVMTGSVDSISRRSAAPLVTGTAGEGRTLTLHVANAAGSSLTAAQFRDAVKALFDPRLNAAGERILVIEGDDGTTDVQTGCYVMQWEYLSQGVDQYVVTLWSPSGIWQATSVTTSASNPATVTNAGNTIAYPTIELSDPATTVTRHACTVTGAGAGGGLIAYPVRIDLEGVTSFSVTSSSTANPAVITTGAAHGLTTGDTVLITGHSDPTIDGTWTATVTSTTTLTIPVNGATNGSGTGGTLYRGLDSSVFNSLSTENFAVYVEGVSVPFYVANSLAAYIWLLVDTASDGTTATNVDILYGAEISNPLAGTLDDGGMAWSDYLNCTNSQWSWNDWSTVSSNPARPGVWRSALTGNHSDAADATYEITVASATGVGIALDAAGTYDTSADSVRLHVGALGGSLTNLSRVTANLDGTNARAYVRYRVPNSAAWANGWNTVANATVTTAITVTGAVEIAAGIENFGTTADPATFGVGGVSGTSTARLTLTSTPTIVIGSATDMDYYTGPYTIGARSITFSDFIVPDGTLTIDCGARSITSSVAGPFYGDEDALAFSHPDQWLVLLPGSNTVTDGLTATDVIEHQEAYG